MQVLSRLDFYQVGRAYVLTRSKKIDPVVVDTAGSDVNLEIGANSFMAAAVSNQLVQNCADLFLDSASDEALDRWVWDRYRLTRKGASPALTDVVFSRPTIAAGGGTIPSGTKLTTLTGVEYFTLADATFTNTGASTDLLAVPVAVRAAQAGKIYQVGRNAIRGFNNVGQIFDQTILVNNPDVAAGGEDREDDDTLKQRARDFWTAAARGTLGAIEFGARLVPGVVTAHAEDVLGAFGQPVRVVNLFIADSSGVASRALAQLVQDKLNEYRAGGIYVTVSLSQPQIVSVLLKLAFAPGVDTVTLTAQVRASVLAFINSLGVAQRLNLADLSAVLVRFKQDGLIVNQSTVVAPVGDIVPDAGRTLRTTAGGVLLAA